MEKQLLGTARNIRVYDPISDGYSFDELVERAKRVVQSGRLARRNGRHRVLANPASEAELRLWLRGWDYEDRVIRAAK